MTLPTIHLNGTSAKDLRSEYDAAADALQTFTEAWGRITCNARDYYVQGPDAYGKARDEREAIGQKITAIVDYLDEIRTHLHSQP
jgi:hypothetical protein